MFLISASARRRSGNEEEEKNYYQGNNRVDHDHRSMLRGIMKSGTQNNKCLGFLNKIRENLLKRGQFFQKYLER
jgi:hypothetical protein